MDKSFQDDELVALLKSGHRHLLPKGHIMSNVGEAMGVSIVERGYIKRYLITEEGNQSIQLIYGPGNIFPLTAIFSTLLGLELFDGDEIFFYEVMSNASIRSIKLTTLQDYCEQNPQIYKDLFYVSGTRFNSWIASVEMLSQGNSYRKLAHQLIYFAEEYGQTSAEGTKILIPLTNQDLAGILKLTRETISRNLSRMQQKGLVKLGKNITIVNIEKLRKEYNK